MFDAIRSNKAPQLIISQIRKQIFEGKLLPGDKLPSENGMMEQFHVSKQTLREALRALEFIGLIEIKKGATGGAYIAEMDSPIALEVLANFLYFNKLSIHNMTEVRRIIEPYTAGIAAEAMTDKEMGALQNLIRLTRKEYNTDSHSQYSFNIDLEFHCMIANSTKNPLLMLIVDFIESLMVDKKTVIRPSREFQASIMEAHERIYAAIVKRDVDSARTEMSRHINEVEGYMLKLQKRFNRKKSIN
jgi:GntR family transcriptional repressor for pyruvate dehydrogenase complex